MPRPLPLWVLLCGALAAGQPAPDCDLVDLFRAMEPAFDAAAVAEVAPADGAGLAWGTSQVLLAYVLMIEATEDPLFVERFLQLGDRVWAVRGDHLGLRDDVRDAVVADWLSTRYSEGKPTCHAVHAGMITFPLVRFARLALARPALARWQGKALEYVRLAEETVAVHDGDWRDGPFSDEGGYYEPHSDLFTSINRHHSLGRTLLELSVIRGRPLYRERTERIARYFKRRITWKPDGTLEWGHFMPDPLGRPPWDEDISHAGASVDFAALCAQEGIVFTREDILRFVKTFNEVVYLGNGEFASTVSGSVWEQRWDLASALRWGRIFQFDPSAVAYLKPLVCAAYGTGTHRRPIAGVPYLLLAERARADSVR